MIFGFFLAMAIGFLVGRGLIGLLPGSDAIFLGVAAMLFFSGIVLYLQKIIEVLKTLKR